jgi:hypothetical protein
MFRRSVVLMDRFAPNFGAFPYALDVAHRLHLPVYGVSFSAWYGPANDPAAAPQESVPNPVPPGRAGQREAQVVGACAWACARASVRWEWSRLNDYPLTALQQAVAPDDLLVLDHALPPAQKHYLFRQTTQDLNRAVLVCPKAWNRLTRVLLVDQESARDDGFLPQAAALCQGLGVEPIVLTVARSERTAKARQEAARAALAERSLRACFDFLVSAEVRAAVACIARWRQCQLVVVPRQASPPWWRWLRGPRVDWVTNGTEFTSFLSLRGTSMSDPAPPSFDHPLSPPEPFYPT